MDSDLSNRGRRRFLQILIAAPAVLAAHVRLLGVEEAAADALLAASSPDSPAARAGRALPATPECDDGDEPTPSQTEGPFFTPSSPKRASLIEPGMAGQHMVLTGRVFTRQCKPVSGALLDFWHCDDAGEYDNQGYRLRGHQFADAEGRYRLETIVPGVYPGRTRHFHLKVQAPKGRILTTQLYFPGETRNRRDGIFQSELLMSVKDTAQGKQARFNFILA